MKYLPWILLVAWVAATIWKWPKPNDDAIKAADRAKDSLMHAYALTHDSLETERMEKALVQEQLIKQFKDYDDLQKKFDKTLAASHALNASGKISLMHSWLRDSIPH